MHTLELRVLGMPQLMQGGQRLHLRTRKTLALLVFLALEPGLHSRDELAELLWSASPTTAQGALRFTLHHLQAALAPTLHLLLSPSGVELPRGGPFQVDALDLEAQAGDRSVTPAPEAAALWHGEFLKGFSLPDLPDWDEWVQVQAQHWNDRFDVLLARLTDALLRSGQLWDAVETAKRRVGHDPLNEDSYRQLIRAQLAAGLNTEAVLTQRGCTEVLRRELGIEPSFRSLGVLRPLPRPQLAIAQAAQRQVLVGREAELQRMDEAWEAGQAVFLAGEAGIGKTALAREFLARHPDFASFQTEAHPIDAGIPYAIQARNIRTSMAALGQPRLPAGLAREMARLVPELWPEPPGPLTDPEHRLRFYEMFIAFIGFVTRVAEPKMLVNLCENMHWMDRESHAMGAYAALNGPERDIVLRAVLTYRPDLLPPDLLEILLPVVKVGGAVVINVLPLDTGQVHELLTQLEPQVRPELAERLHRFTGGNPLFVLETAQLLLSRGGLSQADLSDLPRSPRIKDVIAERLGRLTPDVRDVVRVAAVAGADFSFELAVHILDTDELALAATFEALHADGLFRAEGFAHDLLRDTAYDLTPEMARVVLHRRVLTALAGHQHPAVLARHALGGRCWDQARKLLLQASQEARNVLAHTEAEAFASQALGLPDA